MLLKLLSMNLYDMEENSRLERLVSFKTAYGDSIRAVSELLEKFCPQMDAAERQRFIFSFFPFIYGVYPYTAVTEKQRAAMDAAGVDFAYLSVYQLVYDCAKKLLTSAS